MAQLILNISKGISVAQEIISRRLQSIKKKNALRVYETLLTYIITKDKTWFHVYSTKTTNKSRRHHE